jgi:concanavalin A-like lectin/glucanase superfamily protein
LRGSTSHSVKGTYRGIGPGTSHERGITMLLVLIAVAIATILSMSFLASQATTHGISQNIQGHAQARSVAESALVVAINYVQTDADFRTDKTHGQWVSDASFNGGTFDLFGYDGIDTDGDGVVDDTDSDLADDTSDPITLTAIGYFDGVSHTVHAQVTVGTSIPAKTILMIVADDGSLDPLEQQRRDLIESWGWAVNVLDDSSSSTDYNTALVEVDAVLVPGTVSASAVNSKLREATVGVVVEQSGILDDIKMSSSSSSYTGTAIDIVNASHYITSAFGVGVLQVTSEDTPLGYPNGSLASGVLSLAERPASTKSAITILETGSPLLSSGIAAGRRVWLPTGGVAISGLTSDGQSLFERAMQWASGGDTDEFISGHWTLDDASGLTAYDSSGNGNHGPITAGDPSTQWTSGMVFGALDFDGTGDGFIRVPDDDKLDLSVEGTLAAWVYLTGYQNFMGVIHKGEDRNWSDEAYSLQFWTSRKIALTFTTASGQKRIVGSASLQNGQWYHVAGTWGPNGMSLYVNGVLDAGNSIAAVGVPSDGSVQIGSQLSEYYNSSYKNFPFRGVIDDARIYRRTVTATEMKRIYEAATASKDTPQLVALYEFQESAPTPPAPIGHWKLDDTAGNGTTYDFATRIQGTNIWAYDGQSSSAPPSNYTTPSSQLSGSEYNGIENDDSSSHSYNTSSNNRRSMMRYVFEIDEDEASVSQISVAWIGRNYNEHGSRTDGVKLYIWNYASGSYEQLDISAATESEVTLNGDINANLPDYLGGGSDDTITILAQSRDKRSGKRDNILYCDYVSLSINNGVIATDDTASNDGTVAGGVTAGVTGNGDGGTAFVFDGSDDYVEIAHNDVYLLDNGTVSFWFKPDNTSGHQAMISKDSTNFDTGGHLHVYLDGSTLKVRLQSTNSDNTVQSSGISSGNWYHAVVSWGAGGLKLIVNGTERDTDSYTGGLGTTSGGVGNYEPLVIGAGTWTSSNLVATPITYPYDGVIDDVRIYDQGFDATQADNVYDGNVPGVGAASVVYDTSAVGVPVDLNIQDPANVSWIPGGGITIDSPTLIASAGPATKLYNLLTDSDRITLEVIFTPASATQSGPARIVSYSGGSSSSNITFGQEDDTYITRLRTDTTTSNGTPDIESDPVLVGGTQEHVIVSYDGEKVTMYRNGSTEVVEARTGDLNWDSSFRFMLGDEVTGGRDWLGTLSRVAVYDKAFNATQANNVFSGSPPGNGTAAGVGSVDWIEP